MNRTLIVAAIAALSAGAASAQSSVTIYGRLNTSVEYQKNLDVTDNKTVMQNNGSRLGFMGTEDLGGGLAANFFLEHRFDSDTGQVPGAFWAGDAFVGLSGNFGAINMGRRTSAAYYATADYISFHNHDTGTSADALYTYLSRNGTNTVSYLTPTFSGFNVEISQAAGETVDLDKVTNVAAKYDSGPLHIGVGYEKRDGDDAEQAAVRIMYELGALTLGGYYQHSALGGGNRDAYRASMMYAVGASEFHVNVGFADEFSNLPDSDATQVTVGYNYNLSKRTKVYAFYTEVDNGSINYLGFADRKFSSFALGVRHNF